MVELGIIHELQDVEEAGYPATTEKLVHKFTTVLVMIRLSRRGNP